MCCRGTPPLSVGVFIRRRLSSTRLASTLTRLPGGTILVAVVDFFSSIRWRPTIGDPSFMGWFTVWAYGLAAVLAAWTAKKAGRDRLLEGGPKARKVWIGIAILLALLCINKQLDLQSLLTDIGRVISKSQGWYGERREFQKWFVLGTLAVSGLFGVWFACKSRLFWLNHRLLVSGLFFLLTFIVVRAISFHQVDQFLRTRLGEIKLNWLLELTGIFLVALAAGREIWKGEDRAAKSENR